MERLQFLRLRREAEGVFTLSPEKSAIEHNVKRALLLADKSAYHYYQDFAEKGYYNRIIAGNINQTVRVDSVVCDFNNYPYSATTYARQMIIRSSNVTERSLVTTCRLLNSSRSDDNPNGFTIEGFTIVENKDLQTIRTIRAGAYRWCKGLSNKESRVVTWAMLAVLGLLTLWTIWDVATSM